MYTLGGIVPGGLSEGVLMREKEPVMTRAEGTLLWKEGTASAGALRQELAERILGIEQGPNGWRISEHRG